MIWDVDVRGFSGDPGGSAAQMFDELDAWSEFLGLVRRHGVVVGIERADFDDRLGAMFGKLCGTQFEQLAIRKYDKCLIVLDEIFAQARYWSDRPFGGEALGADVAIDFSGISGDSGQCSGKILQAIEEIGRLPGASGRLVGDFAPSLERCLRTVRLSALSHRTPNWWHYSPYMLGQVARNSSWVVDMLLMLREFVEAHPRRHSGASEFTVRLVGSPQRDVSSSVLREGWKGLVGKLRRAGKVHESGFHIEVSELPERLCGGVGSYNARRSRFMFGCREMFGGPSSGDFACHWDCFHFEHELDSWDFVQMADGSQLDFLDAMRNQGHEYLYQAHL